MHTQEPESDITKDENLSYEGMAINQKYQRVLQYLYPIVQTIPREHGAFKEMFLDVLLSQPNLFVRAGKSNQISKLYEADAGLACLRECMQTAVTLKIKALTQHQHAVAQAYISECGNMLGIWIKNRNKATNKKKQETV